MERLAVPFSKSANHSETWNSAAWAEIPPGRVFNFLPESSPHRPETLFRLAWSEKGIAGIFKVADKWALARHEGFGGQVYRDSCVEIFLSPDLSRGYLNFEFAANGAFLAGLVTDPRRTPEGGLRGFAMLTEDEAARILVSPSLGFCKFEESEREIEWTLGFFIPFSLLSRHFGVEKLKKGDELRANLQKCADDSSRPHWASWSPLPARNFHLPEHFGKLTLA